MQTTDKEGVNDEELLKIITGYVDKHGISSTDISKHAQVSDVTVWKILNNKEGKPRKKTLLTILEGIERILSIKGIYDSKEQQEQKNNTLNEPEISYGLEKELLNSLRENNKLREQLTEYYAREKQDIITINKLKDLLRQHKIDFSHITD